MRIDGGRCFKCSWYGDDCSHKSKAQAHTQILLSPHPQTLARILTKFNCWQDWGEILEAQDCVLVSESTTNERGGEGYIYPTPHPKTSRCCAVTWLSELPTTWSELLTQLKPLAENPLSAEVSYFRGGGSEVPTPVNQQAEHPLSADICNFWRGVLELPTPIDFAETSAHVSALWLSWDVSILISHYSISKSSFHIPL